MMKENKGWAEQQILRCLKVAKEGGAFTYRRNFAADVLELIEELKAENAELTKEADENAALSMQSKMRADRLEAENAELRARLKEISTHDD